MMDFRLARLLCRELFGPRVLKRSRIPLSSISSEQLVDAMANGGAEWGPAAAGYVFHSAQISGVIRGCEVVLDLGCGTAVQLLQVARLNPDIQFVGIDNREFFLEVAAANVAASRLNNIALVSADIRDLGYLKSQSVDGVMSTMTLHHLPTLEDVLLCFKEVTRILKKQGAIYIEDFGRLKREESISYFLNRAYPEERDSFAALYQASMMAAFVADELRQAAAKFLPGIAEIYTTWPVSFLIVIKTRSQPLTSAQRYACSKLIAQFDSQQRRDFDELVSAFRLGGLSRPAM